MFSRRKIAAVVAEGLGSAVLSFVVLTVSRSQLGIAYFVGLAAGLALILFGIALARDVQLNPAYTLALWATRRITTIKAAAFIVAQMLGGYLAFRLYMFFSTTGEVQPLPIDYKVEILVAEALGAFIFTFLAANALRHSSQVVRNVTTGLAYALGAMAASVASVGFINPAAALASNAFGWQTYVAGPVLGAILGVTLYSLLFADRDRVAAVRDGKGSGLVGRLAARRKLNKDAIDVSPSNVEDKPLAKVDEAERDVVEAKTEKSGKNKKNKKSKK
jgi:glycerol uptake facilitator-like aquaporin